MSHRVKLPIRQRWYRSWLGTEQASCDYLNQWWPCLLAHIFVSPGLNRLMGHIIHWKPRDVIMPTLSSLVAPQFADYDYLYLRWAPRVMDKVGITTSPGVQLLVAIVGIIVLVPGGHYWDYSFSTLCVFSMCWSLRCVSWWISIRCWTMLCS